MPTKLERLHKIACGIEGLVSEQEILRSVPQAGELFSLGWFFEPSPGQFASRPWFFNDARFLIRPTPAEIERGILIPGHRFIPFYRYGEVLPKDIRLTDRETGRALPRVRKMMPFDDLGIYYVFYGLENMPGLVAEEDPANMKTLMAVEGGPEVTKALVKVSVFDLQDLYRGADFKQGDYLLCTVRSWLTGDFDLEYCPQGSLSDSIKAHWRDRLDHGMRSCFDYFEAPLDTGETLAYTLWFGGRDLLNSPGGGLNEYVNSNEMGEFVPVGNESLLWKKGTPPAEVPLPSSDMPGVPAGEETPLETAMEALGIDLDEPVLEALFRDCLFAGGTFDDALRGLLLLFPFAPIHTKEANPFLNRAEKLWKSVGRSYDRKADEERGPWRARLVLLYGQFRSWIRTFDHQNVSADEIPSQEMYALNQFVESIFAALLILNVPESLDEEVLAPVRAIVPILENEISGAMEAVTEGLVGPRRRGKTSTGKTGGARAKKGTRVSGKEGRAGKGGSRKKRPKAERVYILRVSIEDCRPPIWRRLAVPGNRTLAELHRILQAGLGWEGYHLHSFELDGRVYGVPTADDWQPVENEDRFRLDDLGLRPKARFRYVYDFGDDWRHKLTIQEVINAETLPEEERDQVVCLSGKRAAPPEDCGGPPGYQSVLRVLAGEPEADAEEAEDRELLEWLEDYDPEFFEKDEVNQLLSLL